MSAIAAACCCGSLSEEPVLCIDHHRYFHKGMELASVTHVLKSCWPVAPGYMGAQPAVLENARLRGVAVDQLICGYVAGTLQPGMMIREDALPLFRSFRLWWNKRQPVNVRAQVILSDDDDRLAGTCDLIADEIIYDLKTVSKLEPHYALQLGGYAQLYKRQYGKDPKGIGIVHINKQLRDPQLTMLDLRECVDDWKTLWAMWEMAQRRLTA